jgi:hypothetical protein
VTSQLLTIQLPDSQDEKSEVLTYLQKKGLLLEPFDKPPSSKWSKVVQEIREAGWDGETAALLEEGRQKFRDEFAFKEDLDEDEL